MTRKETIYEFLRKMKSQNALDAVYTTEEIANAVGASRANVSSDLNRLFEERRVEKLPGWPVRYRASSTLANPLPARSSMNKGRGSLADADRVFDHYAGHNGSMSLEIEKAKAAVLYPLNGLPLLIGGRTGVGKTTFARLLYEYARRCGRLAPDAKFVSFNCADYSTNPQLLTAQLFGCARGAYTGADEERTGLVDAADGGVLFLDEVHRLPATAQEMLFSLMDFSQYRRLGEVDVMRTSHPIIIMATTEEQSSALLATFNRRIPVSITLPALAERSPIERLQLIRQLFAQEAVKLKLNLRVDALVVKTLLAYDCPGNVGQLENDIRVTCAHSYVEFLLGKEDRLSIRITDVPMHVKEGLRRIREVYSDINLIATDLEILLDDAEKGQPEMALFEKKPRIDIYEMLEKKFQGYAQNTTQDRSYIELAMTLDIDNYVQNLMDQDAADNKSPQESHVSEKAVATAQKAAEIVKAALGLTLDEHYLVILATHADTVLQRCSLGKTIKSGPVLERIREDEPKLYEIACQVIEYLRGAGGVQVPDEEICLFASLLRKIVNECDPSRRSGVLALCHAMGSSSTLARVANAVLDRSFVHCLDVPDKLSEDAMVHVICAELDGMQDYSSVLVLTDTPELVAICQKIAQTRAQPLYALDEISTFMLIEAAMMLEEKHASIQQVYRHLISLKSSYRELAERESLRLAAEASHHTIVAACISGVGVATRLKHMIEQAFLLPETVDIVTMDIPSLNALQERLAALAAERDILCVVGMDVGLEMPFPFISVEEFVLGDGNKRLAGILDRFGIQRHTAPEPEDALQEQSFYDGNYLDNYLFYLSGEKLHPYLQEICDELEKSRGPLRRGKRLMLSIHIASMAERIIFDTPQPIKPAAHAALDLTEALMPLAEAYHLEISDEEYSMIEQIFTLTLS